MGSSAGFILSVPRKRGPAFKTRNVSLERPRLHKISLENSGLKGILHPIDPLLRCVQFCNTLRKNNEMRCREPFFQLRFGGREVILNPSRD
jgi:hypothetical protein